MKITICQLKQLIKEQVEEALEIGQVPMIRSELKTLLNDLELGGASREEAKAAIEDELSRL